MESELPSRHAVSKDDDERAPLLGAHVQDMPLEDEESKMKRTYAINQHADMKKTVVSFCVFAVNASLQGYIGIKCVSFNFGSRYVTLRCSVIYR